MGRVRIVDIMRQSAGRQDEVPLYSKIFQGTTVIPERQCCNCVRLFLCRCQVFLSRASFFLLRFERVFRAGNPVGAYRRLPNLTAQPLSQQTAPAAELNAQLQKPRSGAPARDPIALCVFADPLRLRFFNSAPPQKKK